MRVFNIDWGRLILLLLPTFLRKGRVVLFLQNSLRFVKDIHYQLTTYRNAVITDIQRTGQVCKLRGALNDTLDAELRRITIGDIDRREYLMIYNDASERFVDLGLIQLWQDSYVGTEVADFVVNTPSSLRHQEELIKALLDKYKLASKRYIIYYM